MPNNVGAIEAEILLNLSKLGAQLSTASSTIKKFTKGVETDSKENAQGMAGAWQAGFALVSIYGLKAANAIKQAFQDTIATFANFEQSLANTFSIVSKGAETNAEDLLLLEQAAKQVGATTRSTAADAADALYYLASAGFTATEAVAALEGVNALAIATNSDLAQTSEVVAVTIRQYGLETNKATDIANTFTAAITNSLATMDKLAKAFEYVGPIAAGMGLSVEETTAALELLFNKGFSGSKAGRGLRTILVNLADSTSVVNRRLQRLGITFEEINPATNKLGDIFDTLREKGVDATNAAAIFGKVSGAQLQALISTASDATGGIVELEQQITGTNRAFEAMDIQMDTLQGSFDQFRNATEALEIQTGEGLEPVLRSIVDTATDLVRGLAKLSPAVLALGASLATLTGVSLALGAAIVGVGKAAFGLSLTLGPVAGIIAGIGVAVIGLATAVDYLADKRLDRLEGEFGDLAEATNVAEEDLKDFYDTADSISNNIDGIVPTSVMNNAEQFTRLIDNWTTAYGLTKEQVIGIVKASNSLTDEAKATLAVLEAQAEEEKLAAQIRADELAERRGIITARQDEIKVQKLLAKLEQDRLEEQRRNTAAARESLTVAFERAAEYEKLLGDNYDRNKELSSAYLKSVQNLIDQGLAAESEEVQGLLKLYEDLQTQYGTVAAEGLTDTQRREKVQKEIAKGIEEIVQQEKLAQLSGQEYNAAKEKQAVVLKGINELIENGFTIEGAGIQRILGEYGKYIETLGSVNKLAEEYALKTDELNASELEKIEIQRYSAILQAKNNKEAIAQINDYFDLVRKLKEEEDEEKRNKLLQEYSDKLDALNETNLERIEREREAALEAVKGFEEAEEAVNAYYDALVDKQKFEDFKSTFSTVVDIVKQGFSVLNDAIQLSFDKQIRTAERALEAQLVAIDERERAALASAGVLEETELERLQRELAEANATGTALEQQEAQEALTRFQIQDRFRQEREDAELATEKKIARAKYKAALVDWGLTLASTIANTAGAVVKALPNIPLSIAMGVIGATQVGIVAANKPEPPRFSNGGIVPGGTLTGDEVDSKLNSREMVLTRQQQAELFNVANGNGEARPTKVSVYLGKRAILEAVATATRTGELIIDGRSVK